MKRVKNGFIYTVPMGVTLHCPMCPKWDNLLESGDQCFMLDRDSSSFYCLKHMHAAMGAEEPEQEAEEPERAPRREHRRREWERVYG